VRALALWVSVILTIAAAAIASLVVLPPPTKLASYLTVFFDENTIILACGVVVAALFARLSEKHLWIVAQACIAVVVLAVALIPPVQALRIAKLNHVEIDFSRYLRAPVDDGPPAGVETILYATVDGAPLKMDVYRPRTIGGPETRHPAILVLHEGGWSLGDKGSAPRLSAWLAAHGYAVFDAQYRLAPRASWTMAIGDVKCAIGWVKQHAKEIGIDVDASRVTLLGRSAGAHLSMLAAYDPDDPALPPSCDAGDTHVSSVISFYGPTDLAWGWAHTPNPRVFDMKKRVAQYIGGSPAEYPDRYRLLSPINHVSHKSPPTLLIHGGGDNYVPVDNTYFMDRQLTVRGVRHSVLIVPYAEHAFDFIFGGLGEQLAEEVMLRFLRENG
jgi:acetyl esterase/lipase